MPKRKAEEPADGHVDHVGDKEPDSGDNDSSDTSDDDDASDSAPEVSDEEDEDEDDEEGEAFDNIQVDFQFFDPQEKDFHGLKALMHTYLDGLDYDCSNLVETIIQQVVL